MASVDAHGKGHLPKPSLRKDLVGEEVVGVLGLLGASGVVGGKRDGHLSPGHNAATKEQPYLRLHGPNYHHVGTLAPWKPLPLVLSTS